MMTSKQNYSAHVPYKRIFQLVLFSMVIILVGGGVAFLLQPHAASQANGLSIVGPPSLPAATVDAIFTHLGSPMAGTGKAVEKASRKMNIDDAFALAVWWVETNDGEAGVGRADLNPGSVRGSIGFPSAFDGYTIYPSFSTAIVYWFGMLRKVYVNRGLSTIYSIAHPYVGTSSANLWAAKVTKLMLRYRSEAPAPTPTPTAKPKPTTHRKLTKDVLAPQAHTSIANNQVPTPQPAPSARAQYPGWLNLMLLCFVLLVLGSVGALAVWRMRVKQVRPMPIAVEPITAALPVMPLTPMLGAVSLRSSGPLPAWLVPLTTTGDLVESAVIAGIGAEVGTRIEVPLSVPFTSTQRQERDTDAPIRRVVLVPSKLEKTPVPRVVSLPSQPARLLPVHATAAVSGRSAGLLSRYREVQQEERVW